jgi:peptide/nickel transport system substrate-binding protein
MMDRRITRRQLLKGGAAVFAGALGAQALAACAVPVTPAPAAPAAAPQPVSAPAKTLRIVTPENRPLEPQLHASGAQRVLTTNIYENLVTISLDGKSILPQLAESWQRIDDLTWEFKLRQGVKFHSGDPFTAEAVRYSIERYMNPDNQPPQLAQYSFPSVEVVDDHTVRISSEKPDPIFLKRIAGIGTTIVNPRFAEEKGLEGMQKEADGTGPYRVTAWSLDGEIVLEAFEDYWGGAPEIKKVVQTAVVEPGTRVAALLAGEADLITAVPPTEAQAIERGANTKLATVMANRVSFYPFVTNKPPTDNKFLRQACNYASNFDSIIANVLGGRGYRTACMSLPHYFGYNPDLKPYPYDPDKAKQLLEQAGYDGTPIDMLQLVGRIPYDKEVGEALAGELEKVGLKINIKFVDIGGASQALWENPDLKGFHHITWGAGTMDGDYAIGEYWRSDSFFAQKGHHYTNPEFDSIIAEAKYELDPDKREKLYWRAEQIIYDDAVAIWGYAVQLIFGMSKQLQWEPRVDELVLYKEMKLA